jgi:hypothetical protein
VLAAAVGVEAKQVARAGLARPDENFAVLVTGHHSTGFVTFAAAQV